MTNPLPGGAPLPLPFTVCKAYPSLGPECRVCEHPNGWETEGYTVHSCKRDYYVKDPPECCYLGLSGVEAVHALAPTYTDAGAASQGLTMYMTSYNTSAENGFAYGVAGYLDDEIQRYYHADTAGTGGPHQRVQDSTCLFHRQVVSDPDFYKAAIDFPHVPVFPGGQFMFQPAPLGPPDDYMIFAITGNYTSPFRNICLAPTAPFWAYDLQCPFAPWGQELDDILSGRAPNADGITAAVQHAMPCEPGNPLDYAAISKLTFDLMRNPDTGCQQQAGYDDSTFLQSPSEAYLTLWMPGEGLFTNGTGNPDCNTSLMYTEPSPTRRRANADAFIAAWKAAAAQVTGDPHFVGFDGDKFDFRGRNDTVYSLLSTRHFALNALFVSKTFVLGGTCKMCVRKTVHGSFINAVYFRALTSASKTLKVEYRAAEPSHALLSVEGGDSVGMSKQTEVEVDVAKPDSVQYTVDDVTVHLVRKHSREAAITVANGQFEVKVASVFLGWAIQNHFAKRLDVSIMPRGPGLDLKVAPHGLIGQTFDGDGIAIDGMLDDYSTPVVYTKAMGEGAIEGSEADYEIRRSDPFSPLFKYARFDASTAAARDATALTGLHRKAEQSMQQPAGTNGDDNLAQMVAAA